MAPYCAIPRDYLSDTPLLRAMGFLVSRHGQLGAIPPPPFLSLSPLESMRSGGAIPPSAKGYLSDTCAIPYENKASGCDTPLCDTISKGYCAIWGGISHWAAKVASSGVASGPQIPHEDSHKSAHGFETYDRGICWKPARTPRTPKMQSSSKVTEKCHCDIGGDPETHFLATFELLQTFQGSGGSWLVSKCVSRKCSRKMYDGHSTPARPDSFDLTPSTPGMGAWSRAARQA